MKATMTVVQPEKTEIKLTMIATLEEWKKLQSLLKSDSWPASDFSRVLTGVISKTEVSVVVTDKEVS
jgi:hypothetical protein